ncbi:MAG: hypothetical protein WAN66_14135 [Limnoraphis robusta]|uniref:Uncharacterized protein n=1 Tax=Limnoraphis robusta CS-951 TaxID=1637645 RepID=A0A0F5YJF6_9CYAN|nr:hypothetical protein [Limnoraphis robusta]KKD38782.1 hypothetical protein WN50_06980 [Limnoraphis robusta CS-951]
MTAFSINQDAIDLTSFDQFYLMKMLNRRSMKTAAVAGGVGAVFVAGTALATGGAAGTAGDGAKASVEGGVTNAIAMIGAVDGIALAAFGVALAPMGFMLALRILNMVLSRV